MGRSAKLVNTFPRLIPRVLSLPQQRYLAQIYSPALNTDSQKLVQRCSLSFALVASLVGITRSQCVLLHVLCNEHLVVGGKNKRGRMAKKNPSSPQMVAITEYCCIRNVPTMAWAAFDGSPYGLLTRFYGQFNELRHQISLMFEGLKWESAPFFAQQVPDALAFCRSPTGRARSPSEAT